MFFTVIEMLKKCKDFKMNKLICSLYSLYTVLNEQKKNQLFWFGNKWASINEPVYLND